MEQSGVSVPAFCERREGDEERGGRRRWEECEQEGHGVHAPPGPEDGWQLLVEALGFSLQSNSALFNPQLLCSRLHQYIIAARCRLEVLAAEWRNLSAINQKSLFPNPVATKIFYRAKTLVIFKLWHLLTKELTENKTSKNLICLKQSSILISKINQSLDLKIKIHCPM